MGIFVASRKTAKRAERNGSGCGKRARARATGGSSTPGRCVWCECGRQRRESEARNQRLEWLSHHSLNACPNVAVNGGGLRLQLALLLNVAAYGEWSSLTASLIS